MTRLLINIVGFYAGWFACVLGAAREAPWIGPLTVLVLLVVHVRLNPPVKAELALAGLSFALGFIVDSAMTLAGAFSVRLDLLPAGFTSIWMMAMWVNFAMTLNVALKVLKHHPGYAFLLGAAGGPAAYYTGALLGAVRISQPLVLNLAVIGAAWGLVTPLLVLCAGKLRSRFTRKEVLSMKCLNEGGEP
jgi:hypothetical protein